MCLLMAPWLVVSVAFSLSPWVQVWFAIAAAWLVTWLQCCNRERAQPYSTGKAVGMCTNLGLMVMTRISKWGLLFRGFLSQVQRDVMLEITEALDKADAQAIEAEQAAWRRDATRYWVEAAHGSRLEHAKRKKRFRVKAYQWLLATEKILQVCTGSGWSQFQVHQDPSQRGPAASWPTCSISLNQGTDGRAAMGYLEWHQNVCALTIKDLSHRLWNDCWLSIRDASLKPVVVLMMVVLNSDHGPWEDAKWHQELKESAELYMASASVECPLFQGLYPGIVQDMGLEARLGEEGLEGEVFSSVPESVRVKTQKVAGTRCFGLGDSLHAFLPCWHRRLLLVTYLCIQLHIFTAAPVSAVRLGTPKAEEGEDMEKQTTKYESAELRALRRSCRNTMHLVAVVLHEPEIRQLMKGMCCLMGPRRAFQTMQSQASRSCSGVASLLCRMATGAALQPLNDMVGLVRSGALTASMGLYGNGWWPPSMEDLGPGHPEVIAQNILVGRLMIFGLMLLKTRLRSNAWSERGFPGRFAAILGGEPGAKKVLQDLRHAYEVFAAASSQPLAIWKGACKRSPFMQLVVKKAPPSTNHNMYVGCLCCWVLG